nr:polymorphic toxin-type HINT domain-containing protein [Nocardioides daedukensis]
MADGTRKPIEDIEVGDLVVATDPETGEQEPRRVEHVFVHDDTVLDLVVDGEAITTTEDHPFWSVTSQRFERADELDPGEEVLGADGRAITVSGLRLETAREALAYNLTVEGIHTYHVGNADILVHNTCPKVRFGRGDGHGARHLKGTNLSPSEVEPVILRNVQKAAADASSTGSFYGRVTVRGQQIEYRAYTLPDGTINVGTYYVP